MRHLFYYHDTIKYKSDNNMKPFEGLLGNNCELRMLEYLLPLEGMDFNITELAEEVGVSRVTATRIAKKFVEWGILNSVKRANAAYYSIDLESPIVKNIEQLNNILIETILDDEELYEIHDYLEAQKSQVLVDVEKSNVHEAILPNSDRSAFQSKGRQQNPIRHRNY